MTLYAVQHDIAWEDKRANFATVASLLHEAEPAPGSLIVLPEMFATGFSKDLSRTREDARLETEHFLHDIAVAFDCAVIGGLIAPNEAGDKGLNQALFLDPEGKELARYSKVQPFTLGDEHKVHEAGTRIVNASFGGLNIAPLVCYDLRFPELARVAVTQGAEVLVYIASWPIKRIQHWITLLQARAIENQAWVVGVNRCGTDPGFTFPGRSLVVDPHGVIIADAADRQGVLRAELSVDVVQAWRAEFPALRDMRG